MKVGYLGPEGSFSEEAGKLYLKILGSKDQLFSFNTIHDLLYAVNQGKIKEAIAPIENSIEGTITIVPDMLVRDVNLMIKQELVLSIYHYLLAQKGTTLGEITDIISNPPPLEQCREYLHKKLPHAKLHLSYSTSDAVRQVATSLGEKIISHGKVKGGVFAAIGTAAAAKMYGLRVIASRINAQDNQTRFVVLSKKDHARTGNDKTSIAFSIAKDRPGGLHDVLSEFAIRNINLTKIESRPSKKALGDYYFFADLEGHREDPVISQTLKAVKGKTSFLKLLGSYPKAKGG
jgi:prephenate dehydratase